MRIVKNEDGTTEVILTEQEENELAGIVRRNMSFKPALKAGVVEVTIDMKEIDKALMDLRAQKLKELLEKLDQLRDE